MSGAAVEVSPFYIAFRGEGNMVNAYMMPAPHLVQHIEAQGDNASPVLIGCIARQVCDSTGGQDGPIFKQFRALIEAAISVSCKEIYGMVPTSFSEVSPPGVKGN